MFSAVLASDVERVKRAERAYSKSFNTMYGVVHGAGGAGKVKNIIDFAAIERGSDVEFAKLKLRFVAEMSQVRQTSRQQIVDRNNRIAIS